MAVNHDKAIAMAFTHHRSVAMTSHRMEDLGKGHTGHPLNALVVVSLWVYYVLLSALPEQPSSSLLLTGKP